MQRALLPLLFLFLLLSGVIHGQASEADRASLDKARSRLEALAEPQSDEESAWKSAVEERVRLLEELVLTQEEKAGLPSQEADEEELAALTEELERITSEETPSSVTLQTTEELKNYEQQAKAAEAEALRAKTALEDLAARVLRANEELETLPDRAQSARERETTVNAETEGLKAYLAESARFELRACTDRTTFLSEATTAWSAQQPQLQLQLDVATENAERAQKLLKLARTAAATLRQAEAEAERLRAAEEARQAELEQDPVERFRLRIRAEVSNLQADSAAHKTLIEELKRNETLERESVRNIADEHTALLNRLKLRPRGSDVLLRRNLERTRRANKILDEVTLPGLYDAQEENQVVLAEVLDRQWDLSLPDDENPALQNLLLEVDPDLHDETVDTFRKIIKKEKLQSALLERKNLLEATDARYSQIADLITQRDEKLASFEEFIRGRMLWSRSDPPVNGKFFAGALDELVNIPSPYRDDQAWARFWEHLQTRFPIAILALLMILGLGLLRRKISPFHTFGAGREGAARVALRLAAALAWAAAPAGQLWLVSWAIHRVGGPEAFDPPFATLLEFQALFVLIRRLTTALLGKHGVVVGLRGFGGDLGQHIERVVRILTLAGQVLYAPLRVLSESPFHFEALPRILETLWLFFLAVAILVAFRRGGPIVRSWTPPNSLVRSAAGAVWFVGVIILLPTFALDLLGFRVGANQILINVLRVVMAFFVLGGLFRMLRSIGHVVAERIFAKLKTGIEDEKQTEHVHANATQVFSRLTASIMVIVSALLLQQLWGIGDPAQKLLGAIQLIQLEDGRWLSMWDITVAILLISAGHLVASNLGRVHESLVAPFTGGGDVGTRFAAFTLIRYAILSVVYLKAMLLVGFSFDTIGWFVTAASVGIGFGLQEIVANFISGLILLFERPIRVGDIVTIGATSGTVEKITIRSTVITNWERQTMIIPNKKFVTEDLTNWTHNDKVMRRTLMVRVAYGTKVEPVLELLHAIVKGHPKVLEEPPHRIWFNSFGQYGIEFKVLFFTFISDGLATRSDLHAVINARFAQEGIEIPTLQVRVPEPSHED